MVDMKLDVVAHPVCDVDRAKRFYLNMGWRRLKPGLFFIWVPLPTADSRAADREIPEVQALSSA